MTETEARIAQAERLYKQGMKVSEIASTLGVTKNTVYRWKSKCKWTGNDAKSNKENLIPLNKRSKAEQKEISRKGGKASGEARRKRRDMREAVRTVLSMPVPTQSEMRETLKALGIANDDMDYMIAIIVAMIIKGITGDTKAAQWLRDTAGYNPAQSLKEEQFELDRRKTEAYIEKINGCLTVEDILDIDTISQKPGVKQIE